MNAAGCGPCPARSAPPRTAFPAPTPGPAGRQAGSESTPKSCLPAKGNGACKSGRCRGSKRRGPRVSLGQIGPLFPPSASTSDLAKWVRKSCPPLGPRGLGPCVDLSGRWLQKGPCWGRGRLESVGVYPNKHLELGSWCANPEVWGSLDGGSRADAEKGVGSPLFPLLQAPLSSPGRGASSWPPGLAFSPGFWRGPCGAHTRVLRGFRTPSDTLGLHAESPPPPSPRELENRPHTLTWHPNPGRTAWWVSGWIRKQLCSAGLGAGRGGTSTRRSAPGGAVRAAVNSTGADGPRRVTGFRLSPLT